MTITRGMKRPGESTNIMSHCIVSEHNTGGDPDSFATGGISAHTPDPSTVNSPIMVSASVAVIAPGAGTPTGTITITDGTVNCVLTLPAASCNLTPTTTGAKMLTATYSGDSNFGGSVSGIRVSTATARIAP